jgi:hypothetical protein
MTPDPNSVREPLQQAVSLEAEGCCESSARVMLGEVLKQHWRHQLLPGRA